MAIPQKPTNPGPVVPAAPTVTVAPVVPTAADMRLTLARAQTSRRFLGHLRAALGARWTPRAWRGTDFGPDWRNGLATLAVGDGVVRVALADAADQWSVEASLAGRTLVNYSSVPAAGLADAVDVAAAAVRLVAAGVVDARSIQTAA